MTGRTRIAVAGVIGALAVVAPARTETAQAPPIRLTFIGNAAVSMTDGRRTLVTDFPYESGAFGYMTYDRDAVRLGSDVVLLITHGHRDHFAAAAGRAPEWRIIAPADVAAALPAAAVTTAAAVSTGGLAIAPIETPHAGVGHQSYTVAWHGRRFHFTGDTEAPATVIAERGLDIAFVTPWIWAAVQKAGATLDARRVVIYHHTRDERVAGCTGVCDVPAQGASWTVPAATSPARARTSAARRWSHPTR